MTPAPTGTGRNDPCPCGSGKKYKRCCQKADLERAAAAAEPDDEDLLGQALEEPVEIAQTRFEYEDADLVRALFDGIAEARPDGEDAWVLTGRVDTRGGAHTGVPFAWVRLTEDALELVSTHGALLQSARSYVQACDRELFRHVRSVIADVEITLEYLRERDAEDPDVEDPDAEARDLLRTTMRSYYERWIHFPNTTFGERAPLEVARSKSGPQRELLLGILTLLDQRERSCPWAEGLAYDFGEVWRMLQVDREKVMGTAESGSGT